jgi:hypothetical protein
MTVAPLTPLQRSDSYSVGELEQSASKRSEVARTRRGADETHMGGRESYIVAVTHAAKSFQEPCSRFSDTLFKVSVVADDPLSDWSTVGREQLIHVYPGDDLGDLEALVQLANAGMIIGGY